MGLTTLSPPLPLSPHQEVAGVSGAIGCPPPLVQLFLYGVALWFGRSLRCRVWLVGAADHGT